MKLHYSLPTADHLLEDEVDYELRLRKMRPDKRESLEDKRRLLRRLVNEDRKLKVSYAPIVNIMEDNLRIEKKIAELDEMLNKKIDYATVSRLRHYLTRAARAATTDDVEVQVKEDLYSRIQEIFKKYKIKIKNPESESEEDQDKTEQKDKTEQEREEQERGEKENKDREWKEQEQNENEKSEPGKKLLEQKQREKEDRDIEEQTRMNKMKKEQNKGGKVKSHGNKSELELERETNDESNDEKLQGAVRKDRQRFEEYFSEKDRVRRNSSDRKVSLYSVAGKVVERYSENRRSDEHRNENRKEYYNETERKRTCREQEKRVKGDRRSSSEDDHRRYREERDHLERHWRRKDERRSPSHRRSCRRSNRRRSSSPEDRHRGNRREHHNSRDRYYSDSESDKERRQRYRGSRRSRRYSSSSRSPSIERAKYRRSRVQNWELNFSGDGRSIQVEDFLTRVKKLARHEGVTEKELLMNIHHRLKGEAYDWWFTKEDRFTSWRKFEGEIRFRYGNPNRDRGIRGQIRELKQRRGESFIAYVTEVEKLNQCLERPFSYRTLFELIWENMRPHYRSKLSVIDIEDLDHLIEINHKIDANDQSLYRTGQVSRPEIHHLEAEEDSDDCYSEEEDTPVCVIQNRQQQPESKPQQLEKGSKQPTGFRPQPQPRNNSLQQNMTNRQQPRFQNPRYKCWNCLKEGHSWKECREPKRVFCYACGNMGRTTRTCENNHPVMAPQTQHRPTN